MKINFYTPQTVLLFCCCPGPYVIDSKLFNMVAPYNAHIPATQTVQTGSPCLLFNLIMTTYGGPTATLTYKLYCANLSIVFWANNHAKICIEANYQKFQTLIDLFSPVLCLSVFARTTLTETI